MRVEVTIWARVLVLVEERSATTFIWEDKKVWRFTNKLLVISGWMWSTGHESWTRSSQYQARKKVTLATLLPKNSATTWWASRTTGSQETMMVIPYENLKSEISFFIASDQFVLLCFNFNQSIFESMFRLGSKINAGPEESLSLSPSWSTKSWGLEFRKGDPSLKKTWMIGSVSRGPKSKRWRRSHTPVSNLWREVNDRNHSLISTCSVSSLIVWQQGLIVCPYLSPSPRKAEQDMSIANSPPSLKATWSVLKKVSRGGRTSVSVLFLMKSLAQLAITTKHLDIKIRCQDSSHSKAPEGFIHNEYVCATKEKS